MIPETRLEGAMPSTDMLDENPTVSTECSNSETSPIASCNNYVLKKKDLEREDLQDECDYRRNFSDVPNFEYGSNSPLDLKSKQEATAISCISLVSMLMFSIFLCYADRIIMPSCIKSISEEFGFNKSDQGFILGLFYGGYIWTQIIGGYISDTSKLGGKGVLFFGVTFWSLCMIFTSFLSYMGITGFIICRIFLGVGEGVSFPALNSIVGHHIPSKYSSTVISIIIASSFIGGGFAAFVTPPMILSLGWRGPFYVFGLIGVFWSIVWLFLDVKSLSWTNKPSIYEFYDTKEKNDLEIQLPDFQFKKKLSFEISPKYQAKTDLLGSFSIGLDCLNKHEDEKRDSSIEYNIENLQEKKSRYWPIFNFVKVLLLNKSIFAIIVAQYCHGWTQFGFVTWMPIYFTDVCKVNSAYLGYYTTPPWVLQAFFVIFFGFLADKLVSSSIKPIIVRKLFQSVSMFVGAGCQLALVLLNNMGLTSASYAIMVISLMFIFNTMSGGGVTVYQFDIAPEFPAVVYAIGNTFGTIAGLFSVSLTGLILNRSEVNLQVIGSELGGSVLIERWKWVLAIYAIHNIIGGLLFVLLADERQISLNKQIKSNEGDAVSQLSIAKGENINEI
ncbi:Na-dependent inorganic phosphate cotransporter [Cryptosporidium ubiquitum]|uniref:Na-dependent inorganic phosphate cotransporter n=1 Tax=Cryptosporidium ubiquitum TaxID=857276 RepID=A0A1J4MHV9_9CRYT|nr:Na-dependent inorganic phosphate cotransporter [Cryptosporidium ubiquitum]OII73822.1 Na-dependent inorganic phosphate cotransporter [Cryptosporidium ubiquitum]